VSRVFLDTSAAYAVLVSSDVNHARAARAFERLKDASARLITTSYVLVETYALLGRRVGLEAVRGFRDDFEPLLDVTWVDAELHGQGLATLLERSSGDLSLVDAVSFLVMRREGLDDAFTYDRHFEAEGFAGVR
jgi:predicted nucleic acid-binding protein